MSLSVSLAWHFGQRQRFAFVSFHLCPQSRQVVRPLGTLKAKCSTVCRNAHSICRSVIGSNRPLAATTRCWNFVRAFILKNQKVSVPTGSPVSWQPVWVCCGVAVSCAVLLPDRLSVRPFVPAPFLLRSALPCVITRLRLL